MVSVVQVRSLACRAHQPTLSFCFPNVRASSRAFSTYRIGQTSTFAPQRRPSLYPRDATQSPAFRRQKTSTAAKPPSSHATKPASPAAVDVTAKVDLGSDAKHLTRAEQREKDWAILKRLTVNIWPPNDWGVKARVLGGLGLLLAAKVSVYAYICFVL